MELIDSHIHLLYPEKFTYAWCAAEPVLNHAYRLEDYRAAAAGAPAGVTVKSAVFMEADVPAAQQEAEADFFARMTQTERRPLPLAAVMRRRGRNRRIFRRRWSATPGPGPFAGCAGCCTRCRRDWWRRRGSRKISAGWRSTG